MGIEEAIKQNRFKDELHKLVVNIFYTSSYLHGKQSKILKPHGISAEQYNVMRILRGQHPKQSTVTLIQDRMIDRSSNASRLVDKLYKKGLVTRQECRTDRRQMDVCLTDKGLRLLKELDESIDNIHLQLQGITVEEAKIANDILDRIHTDKS